MLRYANTILRKYAQRKRNIRNFNDDCNECKAIEYYVRHKKNSRNGDKKKHCISINEEK